MRLEAKTVRRVYGINEAQKVFFRDIGQILKGIWDTFVKIRSMLGI